MSDQVASKLQKGLAGLFLLAVAVAVPAVMVGWGRLGGDADGPDSEAPVSAPLHQQSEIIPAQGARWSVELDVQGAEYLMGLVFDCLGALRAGEPLPPVKRAPAVPLPSTDAPVFVTVYPAGERRIRVGARTGDLADSVKEAAEKVFRRSGGRLVPETLRVRLDVLREARAFPVEKRRAFAARQFAEPLGVGLSSGDKLSLFLPADVADYRARRHLDMLHVVCRDAGLDATAWRSAVGGGVTMWRLEALGFVNEAPGSRRVLASQRGLTPVGEPTVARVLRACRLAGQYLVKARGEDGSFLAYWNPASDLFGGCESLAEQAAAAAALCALCEFRSSEELLDRGYEALSYLMHYTDADPHDPMMAFSRQEEVCGDVWEVEASAQVLAALCRYRRASGHKEPDPWIRMLAEFLLFMQRDDGLFELAYDAENRFRSTPLRGKGRRVPQAKAAHALCLAYGELQMPRFLAGARRALDRLIEEDEAERPAYTAQEARWLVSSVLDFTAFVPVQKYEAWAARVAASRREAQLRADAAPADDLVGGTLSAPSSALGTSFPPKAGPTADDLVVFVSVCMMAPGVAVQSPEDRERYESNLAAAHRAARYLMQLQYLPENSYYLRDPAASLGGLREQPGLNIVRLQTMEAAVEGLVKLARLKLMRRAERPVLPGRGQND